MQAASDWATHGEGGGTASDLGHELRNEPLDRYGAQVLAGAAAQARRAVSGFALSHDQHVGDFFHLRLADAIAELLVTVVQLGAYSSAAQPLKHASRVFGVLLADRQHPRLYRRQPSGEGPGEVLDQDADEPLERSEDGAMDHDRPSRLPVGVDVLERKTIGLGKV